MASVTQADLSDSCFRGGREGAEVALDGPGVSSLMTSALIPAPGMTPSAGPVLRDGAIRLETLLAAYTPRIQAG